MISDIIGGVIAFGCAVGATYLDCYQALREKASRVPEQFLRSVGLALLAIGCGALATGAFVYSLFGDTGFLDVVLGAAVPNHVARGFYTGVTVLTLIRSKIFQVKGADVGLEYAYKELRSLCLGSINVAATAWRARYLTDHVPKVVDRMVADDDFDKQMQDLVHAAVANADEKTQHTVESQLAEVVAKKPTGAPIVGSRDWSTYCRALSSLVLENCGSAPMKRLIGE